jgi:hypothetical protein
VTVWLRMFGEDQSRPDLGDSAGEGSTSSGGISRGITPAQRLDARRISFVSFSTDSRSAKVAYTCAAA